MHVMIRQLDHYLSSMIVQEFIFSVACSGRYVLHDKDREQRVMLLDARVMNSFSVSVCLSVSLYVRACVRECVRTCAHDNRS